MIVPGGGHGGWSLWSGADIAAVTDANNKQEPHLVSQAWPTTQVSVAGASPSSRAVLLECVSPTDCPSANPTDSSASVGQGSLRRQVPAWWEEETGLGTGCGERYGRERRGRMMDEDGLLGPGTPHRDPRMGAVSVRIGLLGGPVGLAPAHGPPCLRHSHTTWN